MDGLIQIKDGLLAVFVAASFVPVSAFAFCDAPVPPQLTSPELAMDYREEFQLEFETYFRDAQDYLRCVEQERNATMDELKDTTIRYARFLEDAQQWEQLK